MTIQSTSNLLLIITLYHLIIYVTSILLLNNYPIINIELIYWNLLKDILDPVQILRNTSDEYYNDDNNRYQSSKSLFYAFGV